MNTSHWLASKETPSFGKLSSNLDVDLVVIGGGITGITAAYLAKKAGKTVALLERGRCAQMDTGHTTAHLTAVPDLWLSEIEKNFSRDISRAVWDAGQAAIDQIVRIIRAEDIDCDFQWVPGFLHAPSTKDQTAIRDLQEEVQTAQAIGIDATFTEACPLFSTPAVKFAHQALFHPVKYLAALLPIIDGDGSHVFEESPVETVEDSNAVVVGSHQITCRNVFLATHTPLTGKTGTLSALLFQTKLYLHTTYALSARIEGVELPVASFWDTQDPYNYLRIEKDPADGYLAIYGGEDHKTGQEDNTRENFRRLEARFLKIFPSAQIQHHWSGQVVETNDGLPFIGETAPHQFAATGFAGNGTTFGTLSAMMALDYIQGRKNPWADIFQIDRKKLVGSAWEYIRENADYPFFLLRDWMAPADGTATRELKPGEGKILALDGKKVAAYRDDAGNVTMCSPVCTHLKCIVDWNPAEKTWDCPCHGSRFKPTGEVISGPAEENLRKI